MKRPIIGDMGTGLIISIIIMSIHQKQWWIMGTAIASLIMLIYDRINRD